MPVRNDFLCEVCGHSAEYWATRATAPSHCGQTMVWAPSRSAAVDAKESFQETFVESGGRRFKVDSLHAMRQIEKTTEQMHRNGEGQPLVWRDYSQTRSNFDTHTLAKHTTRPMDAQEGFRGGVTELPKGKSNIGIARGADVAKRHGEA